MFQLKIKKIKLKNEQEIIPNKINIIIGPNNSGKSKFLRELADLFYNENDLHYIINKIEVNLPKSYEEFENECNLKSKIFKDEYGNRRLLIYNDYNQGNTYPYMNQNEDYTNRIKDTNTFLEDFGGLFINYLRTENRLTLLNEKNHVNRNHENINFLANLHYGMLEGNGFNLKDVSEETKRLFGKDIELDSCTTSGTMAIRVAEDLNYYRLAFNEDCDAKVKFSKERLIDKEGDGIKSFVSTSISLKYDNKNILLIDEPEAFLHPPLARQLGEIIGQSANENRQIFITTHSSEILKGILSICSDVNVIRITRKEDSNKITILEKEKLLKIMRTPKLRVSKILEGLFCEKVVVTEAEADEIFYQEFLEKIQPQSGVFFTHVNSKANIVPTSLIYRELNVDNAMIFDFDVIRNDNGEFKEILKKLKLNCLDITKYIMLSKKVDTYISSLINPKLDNEKKREEKGKFYHKQGINCLPENLKIDVEKMIEDLYKYNVFVLKNGELETSLQEFDVAYRNNKNIWISDAIDFLDSSSKDKLEKTNIGEFVGRLKK